MEQTILVNCTTTSSDFWSTASSIATVVSIMAVAAASIYRSSTMTPIEKLFISGMDRVWMRIVEGVIKIFLTIVFLLLANFFIPIVVMHLVKMLKWEGNPFLYIFIFWFCRVCFLLALLWIFILVLDLLWVGKLKSWMQKVQGSKDIISLIYLLYALFVFPFISHNLIKELPELFDIEKLINLFQEKWRAVLSIFLVEWVFFISLGIPAFIIDLKKRKVYMKILNLKDGKELFVYFKEDNMLVCGESEDIAKEDKYQCINMDDVYKGNYILKNNVKGQKN